MTEILLKVELNTPNQTYFYTIEIYMDISSKIAILSYGRGRDRMVVGFTTTYAIRAYYH
jgi:hypothetical protein